MKYIPSKIKFNLPLCSNKEIQVDRYCSHEPKSNSHINKHYDSFIIYGTLKCFYCFCLPYFMYYGTCLSIFSVSILFTFTPKRRLVGQKIVNIRNIVSKITRFKKKIFF